MLRLVEDFSNRLQHEHETSYRTEGVMAPWCNPMTLQSEQSRGVGSKPDRAAPLERHDRGGGLD